MQDKGGDFRMEKAYQTIWENIEKACQKVGRNPKEIQVVGVTKTIEIERIIESAKLGITHVGENRVQEFLSKYDVFREQGLTCSLIGPLQTNKVKYIIDKVELIQALDRLKLAAEIDRRAKAAGRVMNCLLEINIGGEATKTGVSPEEGAELAAEIASGYPNISIRGLMAIPPITSDKREQRRTFEKLYQLFVDIRAKSIDNVHMEILSMGMSADYEQAILAGANMIRIGSALYGKRSN